MRPPLHEPWWLPGSSTRQSDPGTRFVGMAKSAQVRIRTSSRRRTNSTAPRVLLGRPVADEGVRRSTSVAAQIEDGIADDLAGAVEGDVAAAVAFEELDAALGEEFGRCDHVGSFRVAAERDDRRVFEQEQDIADLFFFAQSRPVAAARRRPVA